MPSKNERRKKTVTKVRISEAAAKRHSRKAGSHQITKKGKEAIRQAYDKFVFRIALVSCNIAEAKYPHPEKRTTITLGCRHIKEAAKMIGHPCVGK